MTTLDLISNLCAAAREDGAKDDDPVQLKLADVEEICRLANENTFPAAKLETVFDADHNLVRPDCYKA